ncbi:MULTISPECIES: NAD(P)-dependent oxidoreductase [unclassified Kitasatospora]|uniref:NAD(P)-dependent oxidoreductase n=1 Tax=unclassified Kitasatospora TaxID=2633591 RepID=UPI00070FB097|nr:MULTISPECIES: NAD(P)-dependent oxidoreductase [unclassified Kitasatospora]KQV03333.1 hypothetical protein ASC99_16090 [Kitasatospora sp. Root107]KRB66083.1 hypothetical protein ASE03_31380 [Kitasatospora sp. Root187]
MKVTVCGLGRMGTAFAAALVTAGHEVTGWNRTGHGPVQDAVAGAEAVVIAVLDGPAARSVLAGVLAGAALGTLVINASTVGPDESRQLAAEAVAAGLRYVEAPVLGSVPAVRAGSLTVLTGGAATDVAAAEPVLLAWSHAGERRWTGPVGTASALKLVANLTLGIAAAGLRDTLALGESLGLPRGQILDLLAEGQFGRLVTAKRERLAEESYGDADFTLAALAKDLRLALAAGPALPVAEAAARTVAAAVADGGADQDLAALARGQAIS